MARVAMGDEITRPASRSPDRAIDRQKQQRLRWPREDVDETLEYQLKPKFGLHWRECSHKRLWTDQANELGNEISQESGVLADHFPNGVASGRYLPPRHSKPGELAPGRPEPMWSRECL